MLASHARATNRASMPDRCPGANPGGSNHQQSCGLVAKAALLQGADRGFDSLQDYFSDAMPRYANGRAARLGHRRQRWSPSVCRFESCSGYSWKTTWLGRQLADHLGLEPGMLWVRLPPEPLVTTDYVLVEQWSARLPVTQEDHRFAAVPGFKSHRGS